MSRKQTLLCLIAGLTTISAVLFSPSTQRAIGQLASRRPAGLASGDTKQAAPTFKSRGAVEARTNCTRALTKAADDYRQHVRKAKRVYLDSLREAKQGAMQAGDLDEANAIQTELRTVEKEIAAMPQLPTPGVSPELVIRRARYGSGGRVTDIAGILNGQIREGRIDSPQGIPDPAPNMEKTVTIEGTYGGVDFVLSFPESFPVHHFRFGKPSDAQTGDSSK